MEQMEFVHDVEANRREGTDKRESGKNFLCSADSGGSKYWAKIQKENTAGLMLQINGRSIHGV